MELNDKENCFIEELVDVSSIKYMETSVIMVLNLKSSERCIGPDSTVKAVLKL